MIILSWNVRGVGCECFAHEIAELFRLYSPDILFLMETIVNQDRADKILNRIQFLFPYRCTIPFFGFLGGLWVLWKNFPHFTLDILIEHERFIHGSKTDSSRNVKWLVTFIYGYPQHHLQKDLWKQISNIKDTGKNPMIIIGDFNEISNTHERLSLSKSNSTRSTNFNKFIDSNFLIDLGFLGNPYTWYNKRNDSSAVFSRLDRAMANQLWVQIYSSAVVNHLPIIGSNHAPINLNTKSDDFNKIKRFRFEAK